MFAQSLTSFDVSTKTINATLYPFTAHISCWAKLSITLSLPSHVVRALLSNCCSPPLPHWLFSTELLYWLCLQHTAALFGLLGHHILSCLTFNYTKPGCLDDKQHLFTFQVTRHSYNVDTADTANRSIQHWFQSPTTSCLVHRPTTNWRQRKKRFLLKTAIFAVICLVNVQAILKEDNGPT